MNILGPTGVPIRKPPTQDNSNDIALEQRRIREMCDKFGVAPFAEDLIDAGLSSVQAWDRLMAIEQSVVTYPESNDRVGRSRRNRGERE